MEQWRVNGGSKRMHSLGVSEELCGGTSGKGGTETKDDGRKRWRRQADTREAWKMVEGFRDREEQPPTGVRHLYGQKKKAATW